MAAREPETVRVLERALVLLDLLKASNRPMGINELAKLSDNGPSTVFRIIKTLEKTHWVRQLEDDKYILGEKLFFETEKSNFFLAMRDASYPILCRYTAQENQAMNLCVRREEKCVILQQSRTERLLDYVPPIGASMPAYASGNGKVLYSELPAPLLQDLLNLIDFQIFTSHTITTRQAFLQELKKVKEQGYAIDLDESLDNSCCIAVPIRNLSDDIIAAVSFSGFVGNFDEEYLRGYLPALRRASEEITRSLFQSYPDVDGVEYGGARE